jgi:shikimate kinase
VYGFYIFRVGKKDANLMQTVIFRLMKLIAGNQFLRHTRHLRTNSDLEDARGLKLGSSAGRQPLIRATKTSKRVNLNRHKSIKLNNAGEPASSSSSSRK